MTGEKRIIRVSGPVVVAEGMKGSQMYEMVRVGEEKLIGEIIELEGDKATIQVYEDTTGLKPGEKVETTGGPLSVELGPGVLGEIFDGIQRPLDKIKAMTGEFIRRGVDVPSLPREKKWKFKPTVDVGDEVVGGDIIGEVQETKSIVHKIMVPPNISGSIENIEEGKFKVDEKIAEIKTDDGVEELKMMQKWPVRKSRPYKKKLDPDVPLITGQRVQDTFFPIAKGGTAAIPGPFGSGKCVSGDTPILLGDGSLITMEELYKKSLENGKVIEENEHEEIIKLDKPITVYSFDGSKIIKTKTDIFYKGKSDSLIHIKTKSGREVKVTPIHRLFKINENGEIVETMAKDLNEGDYIVAARKIDINNEDEKIDLSKFNEKEIKKLPDKMSPELAEFLGLLFAAGQLDENKLILKIENGNKDILERFSELSLKLFGVECKILENKAIIENKLIVKFVKTLGILESKIPKIILKSKNKCIARFIDGYINASASNNVLSIEDKDLKVQLSYLLTRAGIYHEISHDGIFLHMDNSLLTSVEYGDEVVSVAISSCGETNYPNEIFADQIVEIREITGPFDVYDISIPGIENFFGGFGAILLHNTVTQQQLAKWADADIVIYVGCGERGNEMTEVLEEFPKLEDPRTGRPLMERTVLIANTSNMPVAAREACVYTGITIAEYFRDMGYDVALMADSTSRWAEAMREISGRLEEMPGEEGYPAYLASRLAQFYERAGRVITLGSEDKVASVSVIGAVSPPGGDFSEPVTQNTLRICKVFWALDSSLADRRHFPAIDWLQSYSLYVDSVKDWWKKKIGKDWKAVRDEAMALLQKEAELQEIVQLVGPDALPDIERLTLETARMIREDFLQQNAYHEIDTYCPPEKQFKMLETILLFNRETKKALKKGAPIDKLTQLPVKEDIARMKYIPPDEFEEKVKEIQDKIIKQCEEVLK